jgi:hypothetical protein
MPHMGWPMSPRNPPSALQGPYAHWHTIASPVHVAIRPILPLWHIPQTPAGSKIHFGLMPPPSTPSVSHISLQNEQIFNRNCTKDSHSASSKVSLGKGPTPVIIHSAFSTLSISSPIHTRSPISFSLSQCTRPGYTHQRWC